jgi:hypothetical protein
VTDRKRTRDEIATEVGEIAGAAGRVTSPVPRALDDMEQLAHPGAREVATLTVAARSLDWQFEPVMRALENASKITDWSHPFMVAQSVKGGALGPSFSWRDAPYRYYKSFEDFYAIELEHTFGSWESLQHTWSEVVKGKITEDEGRRIILRGHGGDRRSDQRGNNDDVTTLKANERNTKLHILARLDHDNPKLAALVRSGETSANAAAIEMKYRKKPESKKRPRTELEIARIEKMTKPERRVIWEFLRKEFGK